MVAVPDEIRGELLVAAVVLADNVSPSNEVTEELQEKVKTEYAEFAYPRQIYYLDDLPKTPSGEIQGFIVREALKNG